ncbi:MAG: hypothetical protein RIS70_3237 [Planctomycetota bacterium]
MEYRILGRTGLRVSVLGFGAGPISGLFTSASRSEQIQTATHAIESGINWFDTAAGYGEGASERNLGAVLRAVGASDSIHVATKVRLTVDDLSDIPTAVRRSVQQSLERLQLPRVTLLQLHNGISLQRGDIPTSITVEDVLGPGGVADAFDLLRKEGSASWFGITGTGHADCLRNVMRSGRFDTLQIPYHLANPSAGYPVPPHFSESDAGNVFADCIAGNLGVFAIRVYAGGALLEQPPSEYTYRTQFFPLDLYQRDLLRAARIRSKLPPQVDLAQAALRFSLTHPAVHSALIGFRSPEHIDQAAANASRGRLELEFADRLADFALSYRDLAP